MPPRNKTVTAWLDEWMDAHEVSLKPSTRRSHRASIDRYIKPNIGHQRVQSLSPNQLTILFKKLSESGGKDGKPLSATTVRQARTILRTAMQAAVLDRIIDVNPVVGTKSMKVEKPKHSTWTGEQLGGFLEGQADAQRWSPIWVLAAATGMRRGELMGLRWSDIDLETGVISIERSTTQLGKERATSTPKNHERRRVNIDERTVGTLRTWRTRQAQERLQWGQAYADSEGLVFTWEDGRPILPDYASKLFIKIQGELGLPRLTLHGLRHTHATMLLRAGVPVHIVAKRLGHKDPSVTLDVYADVIPQDDGHAVDVFTKAVWGA